MANLDVLEQNHVYGVLEVAYMMIPKLQISTM